MLYTIYDIDYEEGCNFVGTDAKIIPVAGGIIMAPAQTTTQKKGINSA